MSEIKQKKRTDARIAKLKHNHVSKTNINCEHFYCDACDCPGCQKIRIDNGYQPGLERYRY